MGPKLSVVVCTYNRSEWLRGCLTSLEPQCVDSNLVEVLIIDNNSSDDTRKVSEEFVHRLPNFRYVFESTQGLSHARNRGIKEALGIYVAYIDDDARAHPDWAGAIIRFFETKPDASGVGGPFYPFSTIPIPSWYPEEYGRSRFDGGTRKLRKNEWISGMNMAFKKQALIDVGGFNATIGMTGTKVSYGEETNLTLRMLERNQQIYYCAEMVVDHAILPHKLSLVWLLKSNFANGYDGVKTFNFKGNAVSYLPTLLKATVGALIRFLLSREPYFKTRVYRAAAPWFWHAGFFKRLVGF